MKILILGGSGFVGTQLTKILLESHQVTIGDIAESQTYPELWKKCDVCSEEDLRAVMPGHDCIVNLAAGKPLLLIADETSEIALLIKEHGLGWVVPPGEPDTLVDTLKKIAAVPRKELEIMGQHSREIAKQYFTPDTMLPQYTDLFMQNIDH